ncbi:DUF6266 family protein [Albibacterium bauzanense]|uniref:Uncharacterized protein n=1 Tax=Albibacterium bauzanense TaxID=653929 RepID=A0A4R1LVZ3_9SPHI|nr:DUF6266 family protein [Albibacterium bauzanense]TCK83588.1 hypothetical protein C8N28_2190 [Albibacterium bauzanense]
MAKMKKGLLGPISGKIGDIVGSSWRGIVYVKSRPKRTKPPTEGELGNRFVFAYTQLWLQPIKEFLKVGFKDDNHTVYGVNAAKSYLYKTALTKDGFNSIIHPHLVKVSIGTLPLSDDIKVEKTSPTELTFTWEGGHIADSHPNDQIMLLAYNIQDEDKVIVGDVFGTVAGQFRKNGIDRIQVTPNPQKPDLDYHVYVAFSAMDRSRQSDSIYLGTVTI